MVRGRAEAVDLRVDVLELWARRDLVPWAPGTRHMFNTVIAHRISGRRVQVPGVG